MFFTLQSYDAHANTIFAQHHNFPSSHKSAGRLRPRCGCRTSKRDRAHIAPTGAYAMNLLGLSTQVPMNVVFMTDGSPRKIRLGNNRTITFKHTVPKNLAFTNKTAQLATFALKEIGQNSVNEEHLKTLKHVFTTINEKSIEADYKLMPAWIRKIIKSFYE